MEDVLGVRIVPPRDRKQIRKDTSELRESLGLDQVQYFPIMPIIECILPQLNDDFALEVVEDGELIGRTAETIPDQHCIRVRRTVYDAACKGHPWARQIMAHELGHYIYHTSKLVAYASPEPGEIIPKRFYPEYQADVFAAELLAPVDLIRGMSPTAVAQKFGVPGGMAKSQLRQTSHSKPRKRKKRSDKNLTASQQSSSANLEML